MAAKKKSASAKMLATEEKQEKATTSKKAAATDVIVDVAQEVENLTAPAKAFGMVDELVQSSGFSEFRLGGVLAAIQDKAAQEGNEAWLGGFASFRELIESRFNMHYRKAMYLINIYKNLAEKSIPWSAVKGIGWSKLKELAPILTQKNVEAWAKKADKLTVIQLIDAIKKAEKGKNAEEKESKALTTLTFKLHTDQKDAVKEALEKVKKETKTEFDSVALYNLTQGYLGKSVTIETEGGEEEAPTGKKAAKEFYLKKLQKVMAACGDYNIVFKAFEAVFPKVKVEATVEEEEEKAA